MRIAIMFYVLLIVPSCKSDENLLSQVCSIENQNMHSRFFEKYFEVNYFSNLEEAINCSNETAKPIFIMFVNSPPTGIFKTMKKKYSYQVSYLFDCKKCLEIINREYIPVLLHTDITQKMKFDEKANIQSQILLDEIITKNKLSQNKQLKTKSNYYGKFHQKIQIAATQSLSTPTYLIINRKDQLVTKFGSNKETLYSVLFQ